MADKSTASRYDQTYRRSIEDPEGFWSEAAAAIDWHSPYTRVLDDSRKPFYRWFSGATCNTCYNALDRHIAKGRGAQAALIYDSPVTNTKKTYTYRQLRDEVATFAGVLAGLGVRHGDRVVIYMPMVPETVVAMLACARLGAIHSVVFGGFAANELAVRIDHATPKVMVVGSCGIEPNRIVEYKPLVDQALATTTHQPEALVVFQRPQCEAALTEGRDHDWHALMAKAVPHDCVPVPATDPLYILYTSGTTGQPKGVVRDNGGTMVALYWTMKNFYGVDPGEVYWAASDLGWQVGHCYTVYGPLLHGNTSILFEGKPVGTPDAGTYWRILSEYKAPMLFTAPTAFRAIKQIDPNGTFIKNYDLSHFRTLFLAGERADPDTIQWAERHLGVPVLDHWWQTETGGPAIGNSVGLGRLPVKYGSPTKPIPGWNFDILDEQGKSLPANATGELVIKLPMPPGSLLTLWNADDRYKQTYLDDYPGYYKTADAAFRDEDGYLYVMGRTDDIINVAGHRLSTGAMEEVLASHQDVAECAVIGAADALKGQVPLGLLVLKAGVNRPPEEIVKDVVGLVRERIGPVAAFRSAVVVKRLPKTRSGKIVRATMQKIADSEAYKTPATIDDPATLTEIRDALRTIGYAGK
ncbi:MAG: propionyl-CoA synthetase [Alphaproteobacteria bacterium]